MKNAQMRPGTGQNNSSYLMLGETLDPLMGSESSMGTQINSKFKNYNRNVSPLIPSKQKKAKVQASDQQLNFHDIRHGPQYQHPVVSDLDTINEEMKSHYSHATNIRENRGGLPTLSRKGETFVSQGLDDDIDNEDFDNEDKTFSDSGSNDGVSMNSNLHPKSHAGGAGQSKLQVDWASVTGSDRALSDNKKLAARILRSSTQSKKNKSGKKSNRGSNFNVDRANSSMNVKNKKKVTFPADQFLRIIHEVESYKIYYQPQSTVNNSCCCLLF
ncbi:hypothetical protein FGO68_gene6737 [Halteria grandinella]|uniref:Uncharacterized protein n=1 Tax=Halteria grandinella TaxID=5974 RepID=A0A8J8NZH8_HALGN|nr:hypothetical protein FGO68_gene6737 [Halteria grandinella]